MNPRPGARGSRAVKLGVTLLALAGALAGAVTLAVVLRTGDGVSAVLAEQSRGAPNGSAVPDPKSGPAPSASANAARSAATLEVSAPLTPEALPKSVSFRKTITYNGAPVYVPEDCHGRYDVVLHFHGAHPYVLDEIEGANLDAVLAVFNAGNGAEKYAAAFQAAGTLSSLLQQVARAVAPLCPGAEAEPRRVALMAWSAGYAAVEKILAHAEDRARVDAVLLADGLHAGFIDVRKRELAPAALQSFRDFAELARDNQKLFAITHSSIMTDGYASTTECSRALLAALHIPCDDALVSGRAGLFSIEGFSGIDAHAHVVQFRQMDSSLLPKLRERWQN